MKKSFVLFGLLALMLSSNLYAKDLKEGSVKAPGKGKVVLVGRLSLKKEIDFKSYLLAIGYSEKNAEANPTYCIGQPSIGIGNTAFDLSEPFYYTASVEKDGSVIIPYFHIFVAGSAYDFFRLPCGVKVNVPEGASYVYVGNFQYDLDYAFRPVSFKHLDEFDSAEKALNRATGKTCDLVRGEVEIK